MGETKCDARDRLAEASVPLEASWDGEVEFRASEVWLDLVRVWGKEFTSVTFRRTASMVRRADPECYVVCLPTSGTMHRTWGRVSAAYQPYDLHVFDSTRLGELRAHRERGLVTCVGAEIPRRVLPLPEKVVERVAGHPLPGREGVGALLAGFLTQVSRSGSYRPADRVRLGAVTTNLVSALVEHVLEADIPGEARRGVLVLRAKAYIRQRLHDPELRPATIAAAHHISVSYLHRLFQAEGVPVSVWIREQRLERARRDLADPAMRAVPVYRIGARWGFRQHAAFTRAFRAAFGVAPSDYRHHALTR
ncbi:helix-turn-helix domain-containing protein [Amycolatopsis sp. YIM 10]|uniref:helix-turn-helix domain-containing protein n=1 Tax=Amycolatopsis sp. YIM 10 TaxID=2653857 RepID=UPI001290817F|nr:helix-turn-helix domain-containing protein [Amycolatopsis sp. YIM 10]QFU92717.1 Transcriptional activator NphR [Amycolatopsis sp. YIM 10]